MSASTLSTAARLPVLELVPDASFEARQTMALRDLREGLRLWRLCWTLSWLDIKLRYRGSTLGPFWLTLSTAVMVAALGIVNSALFGMELRDYLPFLSLSLVLWGFLSSLITDACLTFTMVDGTIRSMRAPFSMFAARVVIRNVLILAHNIVVIVAVDAMLQISPGWDALLAIPPFLLWLLDGVALSILLGAFCARFRDIPPIVGSVTQMAFFVSAVLWEPKQLGDGAWMMPFNPFYSILEIVRGPLMGVTPDLFTYSSALIYSALLCGAAWLLFVRVRGRIAFWV